MTSTIAWVKSMSDIATLLTMAKASAAAYETDPAKFYAAMSAIDMTVIQAITSPECQMFSVSWKGKPGLVIRGTQVVSHLSLPEIFDDLDTTAMRAGFGFVMRGAFAPLEKLIPQVQTKPSFITGHSLGGQRAHLASFFFPLAQVFSFGAPKAGDSRFWAANTVPTRVVREHDFAPCWPFERFEQPHDPMLWLHEGKLSSTISRPGLNLSVEDHDVDKYVADLSTL